MSLNTFESLLQQKIEKNSSASKVKGACSNLVPARGCAQELLQSVGRPFPGWSMAKWLSFGQFSNRPKSLSSGCQRRSTQLPYLNRPVSTTPTGVFITKRTNHKWSPRTLCAFVVQTPAFFSAALYMWRHTRGHIRLKIAWNARKKIVTKFFVAFHPESVTNLIFE